MSPWGHCSRMPKAGFRIFLYLSGMKGLSAGSINGVNGLISLVLALPKRTGKEEGVLKE